MTRRITSRLLALVLGAVLVADGFAVAHLQAQDRAQAAADQGARDRAWVEQLRSIALDVQAARAPISDAANVVGEFGPPIRHDVYVRGSATADFEAQLQRIAAVAEVPAPRRAAHQDLAEALQGMTDVVRQLAEDDDSDIEDELRAFTAEARAWDATVVEHVASDLPLATTARDALPLTATGHLYRWSSACSEGLWLDEELGDPGEDRVRAAEVFRGYARNLATTLDELLAVPTSAAEPESARRDIQPALRGLRDAVEAISSFADAVAARDQAGLSRSLVLMDRVEPLFEAAAQAFQVEGSVLCAEYFDPGVLSPQGRDSDDLSRA